MAGMDEAPSHTHGVINGASDLILAASNNAFFSVNGDYDVIE